MCARAAKEYSVGQPPSLDEPAIIRGGCAGWPAQKELTFEYLRQRVGSLQVKVSRREEGMDEQTMPMADYLNYCETAMEEHPMYLREWHYDLTHPEIRDLMTPPRIFHNWLHALPVKGRPEWSWMFVGPANSSTLFHVDVWMSSAWNAVFSGVKEWIFLPPSHPFSVELRKGEYLARPEAANDPEALTVTQGPGDLLFLPSAWGHAVFNRSGGVSFTENFVNDSNYRAVQQYLDETGNAFGKVLRNLRIVHAFDTHAFDR
jgi:histone arginine demethylase JMJD6